MAKAGLNEQRVITAAGELADEVGLGGLTLRALAARLGVRPPSLYEHVKGIEELRAALAIEAHRELAAELRAASVGRARGDALVAMARAHREFAHRRPGLYAASLQAPHPEDKKLRAAVRDVVEVMVSVLRGYALDEEETLHAVRCVRAAVHGFVALEAAHGFGSLDIETTFGMLTQLHLDGLEARRFSTKAPSTAGPRGGASDGDPFRNP